MFRLCDINEVVAFIEKHEDSFEQFIIDVEFTDESYFPEIVVEVVTVDNDYTSMTKREAGNQGEFYCVRLVNIYDNLPLK